MKLKELFKNRLFLLLAVYIALYLAYLFIFNQIKDIWWDSTSYIGLAKYFSSDGINGVFEPMKPILLPLFLVIIIKLGLNVIIFGKLFIFLTSIISLVFVYLITKELFNEKTAFIAGLLTFANPLFFILSYRIYSEMLTLATFFGAIYFTILFIKRDNNWFIILSGALCALSIMSKYPNGLIAILIDFFLLFRSIKTRNFNSLFLFNISLIFFLLPMFFLGFKIGGDYLYFYHTSSQFFQDNLGHVYDIRAFPNIPKLIIPNDNFIYLNSILYLINIILPFCIYGIYKSIKLNKKRVIYLLILPAIFFIIFYQMYHLKGERYIIVLFPILAVFGAYALANIKRSYLILIIILYVSFMMIFSATYLYNSYNGEKGYTDFFSNPPVKLNCSMVSTSDPRSILAHDRISFPYEVYDATWSPEHILNSKSDCIFYFSCYENRSEQLSSLDNLGYQLKFEKNNTRCTYAIFYK